jgi:ATP-dependent metalloprotease
MTQEGNFGSIPALQNAGQVTKDRVLGTANAPIHMVTAETGQFKDQLWRTFRSIALTFLLISGIGALIEDRGISKGLIPWEFVFSFFWINLSQYFLLKFM